MAIQFKCGDCGAGIAVRDGAEGKSVRCPKCKKMQVIPGDAAGPASEASDFSGQDQPSQKAPQKRPCLRCGTPVQPGTACPKCSAGAGRSVPPSDIGRHVWKFVTIAIILAIVGGLVWGIMYTLKNVGQTGEQYAQGLAGGLERAKDVTCQENLANLYKTLAIFRQSEQGPPMTLHELIQKNYSGPENLRCPKTKTDFEYIYQAETESPQNVLVYEPDAPHEGKGYVLRLNGRIDCVTSDQLKAEVDATHKRLARR